MKLNIKNRVTPAFTVIELIIVITVIGILASLTIVAYNGIQQNAHQSALMSNLDNSAAIMAHDLNTNGAYPTSVAAADGGNGLPADSGTTYQYTVNNSASPPVFCLTGTNNNIVYYINSSTDTPKQGVCPYLNYDASVAASYPGSGTVWTDLSGNGNNGTLNGGVTYSSANGGVLTFDGTSGYVSTAIIPSYNSFALSIWFKTASPRDGDRLYWGAGTNRAILENNNTSGQLGWYVQTSTANTSYQYTAAKFVVNQWNNVVLQYTGSQVQCFINGVQDAVTANITGTSNASAFNIGTNYSHSANWYNGQIGNFSFYDRSLSANEIMQNFNSLRGRYGL